jgi:excisionase family DNA binding protein
MAESTARIVEPNEKMDAGSDILSLPEACKFLRVHRNTLYKLIKDGELPAFRLMQGGRWRFRKGDLEQWLEDCQARRRL